MVGLNISLEPEFVISAELALLKEKTKELGLTAEQQRKVSEVRKKGRNNMTAASSRKRQIENLEDLQVIELNFLNINIFFFKCSREKLQQ